MLSKTLAETYIGNGLAKIGYVRRRDHEFGAKFIDRKILYLEIEETITIVSNGLSKITDEQLSETFPMIVWEEETERAFTLLHLHAHLNYHLGQINYHLRLLDKGSKRYGYVMFYSTFLALVMPDRLLILLLI